MLRPRGRDPVVADPAAAGIDQRWTRTSRADRLARVAGVDSVASTGTVRLAFEVVDDRPFAFTPGQFVGMEYAVERLGYRRSPYCLLSATPDRRFELLVRVVEGGTVSRYLGSLGVGDEVGFRGPTGRSMVPRDLTRHIVMLATGVGVAPSCFLARSLLADGFAPPIDLYWGLRLADDICLTAELDELAARHRNFSYHITLSQPPPAWDGLRGRLTESVPPALATLGGKHFTLYGNGAMTEEMSVALSDMGVAKEFLDAEPYFNRRHEADAATIEAIRERFVATDLFSPYVHQLTELFHLESPLHGGNADPTAPSDVSRHMPSQGPPPPPP